MLRASFPLKHVWIPARASLGRNDGECTRTFRLTSYPPKQTDSGSPYALAGMTRNANSWWLDSAPQRLCGLLVFSSRVTNSTYPFFSRKRKYFTKSKFVEPTSNRVSRITSASDRRPSHQ